MSVDRSVSIPFSFDRNGRPGLARQLADGFRRAIGDGLYSAGETLPSIRELSVALNVSEITVRGAMKRLTADGLISPRRGIGAVVTGSKGRLARGRVLLVTMEVSPNYCYSVIAGILRKRLVAEGYLPYQITVEVDSSGRADYSQLDQLLGETVSLAVILGSRRDVWKRLADAGVPTLVLGECGANRVRFDAAAALPEFIDHCRAAGVGRVVLPMTVGASTVQLERIRKGGIAVERWTIRHDAAATTLQERVFRGSFNYVMRRFRNRNKDRRDRLPDVLFFIDDFVAAGALYAMDLLGIRVPEDVGVVTWCAKGSFPFYRKRLTRLEMDPEEGGRILSRHALVLLSGHALPEESIISRYVQGETFLSS